VTCPSCGLALPARARYCARCGTRLPEGAPPAQPAWLLALFGLGAALTALVALLYGAVLASPELAAGSGLDPAQVREGATILAAAGAGMCAVQIAALAGLLLGKRWGRPAATVACVAWALTCVGLPLSLLVLSALWRRRPARA
jgi:hypothetical protein